MRNLSLLVFMPLLALVMVNSRPASAQDSIVIVLKDGTQKTFAMADVARIEFTSPKKTVGTSGQGRYLGKWKVGVGGGTLGTFMITLDRDGEATKTLGSVHGKWVVVDGEARITWDDGWHDAIRRSGSKYEKAAYGPGKSFSDNPDNVTTAVRTEASPI
jgi:hypothetical protein